MNIGGFQSFTLIDYPNKMACIVFTQGCDFRCPYCQNPELVLGTAKSIPQEEIISFLWKRRGMLEGVVISGGEPTIQRDLEDFVKRIKDMGYLVKLDTNGHNPHVIQRLIDLLDYVAMDVKAPLYKYEEVVRAKADVKRIEESIRLIIRWVRNCFLINLAKYTAVASPSTLGLVARIISLTEYFSILSNKLSILRSFGDIPSRGAILPPRT